MPPTLDNVADAEVIDGAGVERSLARREKLINNFARVTQFITWPFFYVIFHTLFKINMNGRENFSKVSGPFIIIANHINFYDSFLFRLALGFNTPHLPLRFMAVNSFEKRYLNYLALFGIIDFVYSLFGVFTIQPGKGIYANLEEAREIIKVGGNVVIYPEGRIVTMNGIGPFKKGAAVLLQQTKVPLIPVTFRIDKGNWLRRTTITINIGNQIVNDPLLSAENLTEKFHTEIERLYSLR